MTSPHDYTTQQECAIKKRGVSIALDAGAGCGKTFVLTERFLSHLAPHEDALELNELVAITFTDAAAREMRDRVRAKCLERLTKSQDRNAEYWLRLLRMLDAARVSTIHAFCANLVRAHALELGLDPGFAVLDQPAADVLLSEATDDCLRLALEARDEDVMTLAAEFGLGGLKSRLAPLREHVGDLGLESWVSNPPEETVAAWRDYFREEVAPAEKQRLAESPEIDLIRSIIPESTATPETRALLAELDELLAKTQAQEASDEDFARIRELARVRGFCGKNSDWPSPEIKKLYTDACAALRKRLDKRSTWRDDPSQLEAARMGQRLARVARQVVAEYQQSKASAAALDFNDLLSLARRLLTDDAFRDIQRRLRQSTKLLLVDEFQDTDRVQAEIVTSLVGEGLVDGRLFFVGDFKQSIYRFRGAEPQVFRDLQDRTPEEGRLPLSQNFRSQPAVLDFVNALFAPLFGRGYTALSPARPQVAPAPGVEFLWTEAPARANVESARRAEARRIAQRVCELLIDPTERVAVMTDGQWRARRVQEGDIAILFRALSDVQYYEEALRDAGVDYHLIGGHAFYSQQEVFDLLNLLRTVASGCDEVSLAGVLRSPFFALQDETLLWLTRSSGSLNAGLLRNAPIQELGDEQQSRVNAARAVIGELRRMKGVADTAEVIRVALERTGYDASLLAEFLGERKLANLNKIVEQARAADRARPGDIDAFVRQLSEFIARQPKEALAATAAEDSKVVRLMTVHHAKGLEFPVVIVADLARPLKSDASTSAFDPQLGPLVKPNNTEESAPIGLRLYQQLQTQQERDELVRLFYVACTRAADLLVLSSAVEDFEKLKGEWLNSLASVFNLQDGAVLASGESGLANVVPAPERFENSQSEASRRSNLPKLIGKAQRAASGPVELDRAVEPIALNPLDLRRFSVSRLSGKLHYRADRRRDARSGEQSEAIDPLKFGTLVHAVMERVDFKNPQNVGRWCAALAPLHLRRNWEPAAKEAEELVNRFLLSPRSHALQESPQVRREIEFVMRWPLAGGGSQALLQGYIDCLYQDPQGGWRLLDYKTNRVTVDAVPQEAESYRLQMAVYALAVEQTLGASPVALELHFLRPGVEATFVWNEETREAAIAAIDNAIVQVRHDAAPHV